MTRKCNNLKPQTIQWHPEEETHNIDGHINRQQKSHCLRTEAAEAIRVGGGGGGGGGGLKFYWPQSEIFIKGIFFPAIAHVFFTIIQL